MNRPQFEAEIFLTITHAARVECNHGLLIKNEIDPTRGFSAVDPSSRARKTGAALRKVAYLAEPALALARDQGRRKHRQARKAALFIRAHCPNDSRHEHRRASGASTAMAKYLHRRRACNPTCSGESGDHHQDRRGEGNGAELK